VKLSDNTKGNLAYGWLWCWLLLVLYASTWGYIQLIDAIAIAFVGVPTLSAVATTDVDPAFSMMLKVVLGILFCWRIVKIMVLHGSPIPWGLQLSSGRENRGESGRCVHISSIQHGERLWFGAVLRAHPASDKLARTRLEFLVFALPFGYGLGVHESRIYWISRSKENGRRQFFIRTASKYWKKSTPISTDKFRRDVVRCLDRISKDYGKGKRIDGLNWQSAMGNKISIQDDFGYSLQADNVGDGTFKVSGLGANGDKMATVQSVDELRELAKRTLHPVQG